MSAPTMEERKACWAARDEFWRCLDTHTEDAPRCEKLRRSFESLCPQQWVSRAAGPRRCGAGCERGPGAAPLC